MKFTISDCMSRINQALNYPAISYEDVSHFFDQAITELNTSLRISLPTVTEMRFENIFKVSEAPNVVALTKSPTAKIEVVDTVPEGAPSSTGNTIVYYYNASYRFDSSFYIYKNNTWTAFKKAYGIFRGDAFEFFDLYGEAPAYKKVPLEFVSEFSLTEYLPVDWIILFLIPYVCFKFSVRNGDSGGVFNDEFTQGFQQLQTSYNVPNSVVLSTVAHKPAYKSLVESSLHDLTRTVQTRAIFDDMKVPNGIHTIHGAGVFDLGGWGV